MKPRYVYSVRRARRNLVDAIKNEIWSASHSNKYVAHSMYVYAREAAIRDLIASVRAEEVR